MIRTSICVHCCKLIETDNATSLMLGETWWRHIGSGVACCEWPIDLDLVGYFRLCSTFAKPICMPMFSEIDGEYCDWIGN